VLCSCTRDAIENFLAIRLSHPVRKEAYPNGWFILDPRHFPYALVAQLRISGAPSEFDIMEWLQFQHKLCHECNHAVPSFRYCHEMYGTVFKQNFGWYINKQAYEYGVDPDYQHAPDQETILLDRCPQDIRELWEHDQLDTRVIWHVIENEVRRKFDHKKVGEAWTSETILYHIVRSLFPALQVLRHHRPTFLEGLELDIFIPEMNLGIEYQGVQHFKLIKHWGGTESLAKLQQRDRRKKALCDLARIQLIYFYHDENLSDEHVSNRLKEFLGSTR